MEKLSGGSLKALIDAKTKGIYPTKGIKYILISLFIIKWLDQNNYCKYNG